MMKQIFLTLVVLLLAINSNAQISYSGLLDNYPIELYCYIYQDGYVDAFYVYTDYDTPIPLKGKLKQKTLTFQENYKNGKTRATLIFNNFEEQGKELSGVWKEIASGKGHNITLTKTTFEIEDSRDSAWKDKELLQSETLPNEYFKLVLSKEKDDYSPKVVGIKLIKKKTDSLVQYLEDIDCEFRGLDCIQIDDYNFDGIKDFSIFEYSYFGPNTTRLYFLYDPVKKKYFNSGFEGVSLEFDRKRKRIYEDNQSRAGASHIHAEYKVVKNKMILLKKTCTEYDEGKKKFIKVKCDD